MCHWCSYHILTSSVIYYWIRRTAAWNLFVLYNDERAFFISKYFNITRKPAFCPALAPPLHEKSHLTWLWSIENEAISLVAMRSKELRLVEKNRVTVKPDSSVAPRWMKTYSESRIELRNQEILKKMLEKSSLKSVFVIGATLWAEKLGHCLENYRSWKNTLGKLLVTVNLEAIWFEFWMKGA